MCPEYVGDVHSFFSVILSYSHHQHLFCAYIHWGFYMHLQRSIISVSLQLGAQFVLLAHVCWGPLMQTVADWLSGMTWEEANLQLGPGLHGQGRCDSVTAGIHLQTDLMLPAEAAQPHSCDVVRCDSLWQAYSKNMQTPCSMKKSAKWNL